VTEGGVHRGVVRGFDLGPHPFVAQRPQRGHRLHRRERQVERRDHVALGRLGDPSPQRRQLVAHRGTAVASGPLLDCFGHAFLDGAEHREPATERAAGGRVDGLAVEGGHLLGRDLAGQAEAGEAGAPPAARLLTLTRVAVVPRGSHLAGQVLVARARGHPTDRQRPGVTRRLGRDAPGQPVDAPPAGR
jgi:hypothetical protein